MFAYLRSKYIVITHGLYNSKAGHPKKKLVINVWHGMPIKNIGLLDSLTTNVLARCDVLIATSALFRPLMARAFNVDIQDVILSGLPRNDILTKRTCRTYDFLNTEKYMVWLPTYRKSDKLDVRLDGEVLEGVFGLSVAQLGVLNRVLAKMEVTLVVKPHPMDSSRPGKSDFSHISVIDERDILRNDSSLYEILGCSITLITDVSSVLIDYILTEKPVVLFFPDYERYSNSRGYAFDFDPYDYGDFFAATGDELIDRVSSILEKQVVWPYHWDSFGYHDVRSGFTEKLLSELSIKSD